MKKSALEIRIEVCSVEENFELKNLLKNAHK